MCGPHTSLRTSSSSHPTYGPAKTTGRSQTRPVFLSLNTEEFRYIVVIRKLDVTQLYLQL